MKPFNSFLLGYLSASLIANAILQYKYKGYKLDCPEIKLPPVEVKPIPKKALVQIYPDPKPPAFDFPKQDSVKVDTIKSDTIPWHWDVLGRRIYYG